MKKYYITFRSVTYAQRGERILKRSGMDCLLRRTPRVLAQSGCGYCLQIRAADVSEAMALLHGAQLQYGKVYAMEHSGSYEEIGV